MCVFFSKSKNKNGQSLTFNPWCDWLQNPHFFPLWMTMCNFLNHGNLLLDLRTRLLGSGCQSSTAGMGGVWSRAEPRMNWSLLESDMQPLWKPFGKIQAPRPGKSNNQPATCQRQTVNLGSRSKNPTWVEMAVEGGQAFSKGELWPR